MVTDMTAEQLIQDLDRFSVTFKHTANVKYGVEFTNSNIADTQDKLKQLHHNISNRVCNDVHVGYDLIIQDVVHVQMLIETLVMRYKERFTPYPPKKLRDLINQLREAEKVTPDNIAKEVLTSILTPKQPKKLSKKQRVEAKAEAFSMRRAIEGIKKNR